MSKVPETLDHQITVVTRSFEVWVPVPEKASSQATVD